MARDATFSERRETMPELEELDRVAATMERMATAAAVVRAVATTVAALLPMAAAAGVEARRLAVRQAAAPELLPVHRARAASPPPCSVPPL